MDISLIAYSPIDGIPTMTDSEVRGFYSRMESDGTAETVFADGSIRSADAFLNIMKHGHNQLFVAIVDKEASGIIWLNNFEIKMASFHFCFFSNAWKKDVVEIGQYCVRKILNMTRDDEFLFDALTGVVPSTNKRAQKWCKKMGFTVIGIVPCGAWISALGKSVPATIYYVERGIYGQRK